MIKSKKKQVLKLKSNLGIGKLAGLALGNWKTNGASRHHFLEWSPPTFTYMTWGLLIFSKKSKQVKTHLIKQNIWSEDAWIWMHTWLAVAWSPPTITYMTWGLLYFKRHEKEAEQVQPLWKLIWSYRISEDAYDITHRWSGLLLLLHIWSRGSPGLDF